MNRKGDVGMEWLLKVGYQALLVVVCLGVFAYLTYYIVQFFKGESFAIVACNAFSIVKLCAKADNLVKEQFVTFSGQLNQCREEKKACPEAYQTLGKLLQQGNKLRIINKCGKEGNCPDIKDAFDHYECGASETCSGGKSELRLIKKGKAIVTAKREFGVPVCNEQGQSGYYVVQDLAQGDQKTILVSVSEILLRIDYKIYVTSIDYNVDNVCLRIKKGEKK